MEFAIACTGLSKNFDAVRAVNEVSLAVVPGEVFGVVGPDGAGKTTLIRMLCGILDPNSGSIDVLGFKFPKEVDKVVSELGYMSQRFSLYADLTVLENIRFFADIHEVARKDRLERTERLLNASRMDQFGDRMAGDLSGGMKQKLALACTLVHTPKVLFLDEPTTGVDPISRREFWQILYGLVAEGMTLFVSTPYMDEADRCQRLALMNRGRLLMCDTPANLRASISRTVIEVYSSDPRAAAARLSRCDEIIAVEAFGERLHATAKEGVDIAKLKAMMEGDGVGVSDIRIVAPSLEDAFIAAIDGGKSRG
jgi:ABC-2 type transport system ATP-binding protein